eukprot:2205265-Prymnesium_polylepis.1
MPHMLSDQNYHLCVYAARVSGCRCDARGGNRTGTGCSGQGLHWHWECVGCAPTLAPHWVP